MAGHHADGDVAVALARAGLSEQALAKIAENLARWPGEVRIRVGAGDALLALGDRMRRPPSNAYRPPARQTSQRYPKSFR